MSKILVRWIVVLLFWGCFAGAVCAQPNCKIEHYSTEDGLSHNRIMCMLKDRDGFMWFGTWDGLNRFDGHNFVAYKSRAGDNSSLKSSRIQEMVEDGWGNLWLKAYDNRVYRFNKRTEQFFFVQPAKPNVQKQYPVYNKIIRSKSGQIWLTTENGGLYWFARPNAEKLAPVWFAQNQDAKHRLAGNSINFFHEEDNGNVWVGTAQGITRLVKNKSQGYEVSNMPIPATQSVNFTAIGEDARYIWLGTSAGELICLDNKRGFQRLTKPTHSAITTIVPSRNRKSVYATTASSQVIVTDTNALHTNVYELPSAGKFCAAYEDSHGLLWLCPEHHGAVKFDPATKRFKLFDQAADTYNDPHLLYFRIFEDKAGLLWLSMRNGGFGYYDRQKDSVAYFYNKPGSPDFRFSNVVVCMYYDPSGILWLNAEDKGLNKVVFLYNNFTKKLLASNTLLRSDNEVRGIGYDNKGRLWLANKSWQVYVSQNSRLLPVKFVNAPPQGIGAVYSIVQDTSGAMWLGTKNNGLFKAEAINGEGTTYKLTHFVHNPADKYSISGNSVYTLLKDNKGRIWAGTYDNGINQLQTVGNGIRFLNSKTRFTNWPANAYLKIRYMQQDAAGRVWVATTDGLLVLDVNDKNDRSRLITYSKMPGDRQSLSKNDIQFIYRDSKNQMWLATSGGGLNKAIGTDPFNQLTFKAYTTENGLTSDYILSCVEDNAHQLWIATENGLSRFDPATGRVQNYDSSDGLPKSGFAEAASVRLPSGELVFGGLNGFVSFNPKQIAEHKVAAHMALTNLQVNNADITTNDSSGILKANINQVSELKLKWNQNTISIDYSVLDYRLSAKQTYAFRLLGFDTQWRNNQAQRRATYTNLHPGTYQFEVVASNTGSYSNKPYKHLSITIAQPPWLSWWAYLIYFIVGATVLELIRRTLFTVIRLKHRVALERHMAELKTNFFTNVSHELRTPLTLILNPIEELRQDETLSRQNKAYMDMVSRNARRMERFINQLLDLRKAESGSAVLKVSNVDLVSLLRDIAGYFTEAAQEKGIDLRFDFPAPGLMVWLDVEKFDIVIYNLLANALKFTGAHKVITISLQTDPLSSNYTLQIADQGIGVPEQNLNNIFKLYYTAETDSGLNPGGTGIGLALAKELIELHTGQISAQNNIDGGLTVTLTMPLGKSYLTGRKVSFADEMPPLPSAFEASVQELLLQSQIQQPACAADGLPLLLIVEDNKDLRYFLKDQLSDFFRIELAENGHDGIQKARQLLPDIILSDVMMPQVSGIQLLDKLKNDQNTSHIPIILLTARFAVEHQIEGLKYGADYYIPKPFNKAFLLSAIRNVLAQRRRIFEGLTANRKATVPEPADIQITSGDEIFLKKVIEVITGHMDDAGFNIDDMAESLNLGRSTFNKKVKSLTGFTPVELLRDTRLKRGRQYLDKGEHNISEIAYLTGFGSSRYFSTCFKEHYGMSPSEYLRQNVQNGK